MRSRFAGPGCAGIVGDNVGRILGGFSLRLGGEGLQRSPTPPFGSPSVTFSLPGLTHDGGIIVRSPFVEDRKKGVLGYRMINLGDSWPRFLSSRTDPAICGSLRPCSGHGGT